MKIFFKYLIFWVLIITVFIFRVPLGAQLRALFVAPPCTKPINYTLGTFDVQFNISKDYFLDALTDAEAVWEKPFEKNLFAYAPADSSKQVLKINLIYDYRQEATSKLASLGIVVKNDKASYDALKAKFTSLKAEHARENGIYNAQVEDFNQKKQSYDMEVAYWNKKGGAPEGEYWRIEKDRVELGALARELQSAQVKINNIADEINALVVALNRLATTLNLSVEKYNTTNVARGESFEEGVYESDGLTREIDIYEFSSREKLVRVLAHELGHALGMEHVADPKAIMYEFNQGNSEAVSDADMVELRMRCGVK